MIDVSNIVLRAVKEAVLAVYDDCYFTTTNPEAVTKNRVVSMTELDNRTYTRSLDTELKEHHAYVSFQFDAYSNNTSGKKEEAKAIMNLIDEAMLGMNFVRTMCQPTPNIDRSYARYTARYEGVASEGRDDGNGNIVHDLYRK